MRLHKKRICSVLAALIAATLFASMFSVAASAAEPYVPVNDVVAAASEIIYANEGYYGTVVKNDVGALSVGKVQWHANRARELLLNIMIRNWPSALNILGEALYREIENGADWSYRVLNDDEAARVSALLDTAEGHAAQDEFAFLDIKSYVLHGKYMGITDPAALVYFADTENQYGFTGVLYPARRAAEWAGSYGAVTLEQMYRAAVEVYPQYLTRKERTYRAAQALNFVYATEMPEYDVWRLDSAVNMRTGPGTDYLILQTLGSGTEIRVYSKIWRGGYTWGETDTGWVVLDFCTYRYTTPAETPTPPDPPQPPAALQGDVSGDGVRTLSDVMLLARNVLDGHALPDPSVADMTGDGAISLADVVLLARLVLNG